MYITLLTQEFKNMQKIHSDCGNIFHLKYVCACYILSRKMKMEVRYFLVTTLEVIS